MSSRSATQVSPPPRDYMGPMHPTMGASRAQVVDGEQAEEPKSSPDIPMGVVVEVVVMSLLVPACDEPINAPESKQKEMMRKYWEISVQDSEPDAEARKEEKNMNQWFKTG